MAFACLYDQDPPTDLTRLTANRIIEVAVFETLNEEIFD
jgi:hypothetical protein